MQIRRRQTAHTRYLFIYLKPPGASYETVIHVVAARRNSDAAHSVSVLSSGDI
jgi:hypothetical protein